MIRPRILAISGSLRAQSSNTALLRAAASIAKPIADVTFFDGVGDLPHFNPDLDGEGAIPPKKVEEFRSAVRHADAILISSPEYAHGVPGSLKNALDWLVSGSEIPGKPVGLLNASSRAVHANAALAETLRTMSASVVPSAPITVPLDGRRLTAESIEVDQSLAELLRSVIDVLVAAARRSSLNISVSCGS